MRRANIERIISYPQATISLQNINALISGFFIHNHTINKIFNIAHLFNLETIRSNNLLIAKRGNATIAFYVDNNSVKEQLLAIPFEKPDNKNIKFIDKIINNGNATIYLIDEVAFFAEISKYY
jgi:chemotaxis signal transduction protein